MSGSELLLIVGGAVALLLWGTRMARTGFLRAFGAELRQRLARGTRSRWRAAATGLASASLLQSSTATALLAASFAGAGLLDVTAGLSIMLGADLGSAAVAQVLALDITGLWPLLVFAGFVVHTVAYDRSPRVKQYGRITLGIGLMLLALHSLGEAADALRASSLTATVLGSLGNEPALAIVIAMGLTWLAHSSLAIVLLVASLAAAGVVDTPLSVALVLGVNAGAALPAFFMTLSQAADARRIALGNLMFRFAGVLLVWPFIAPVATALESVSADGGSRAMLLHLAFNAGLLALFIGLTDPVARLTRRLVAEPAQGDDPGRPRHLDRTASDLPTVALGLAARETLRMGDIVETMLRQSMVALEQGDQALCASIQAMDDDVDRLYEAIKLYLAEVSREQLEEEDARRCFDIIAFTTNLENIGDAIDKSLIDTTLNKIRQRKSFSPEGMEELRHMHAYVLDTMRLALTVFIDTDTDAARQLLQRKDAFRAMEQENTQAHMERLRRGNAQSIESSSLHLDILRDLKRINSHLSSVAYPILDAAGQLRRTRLKKSENRSRPAAEIGEIPAENRDLTRPKP